MPGAFIRACSLAASGFPNFWEKELKIYSYFVTEMIKQQSPYWLYELEDIT